MIYKDLKIFSQNVWKNSLLINTILEVNSSFDIIFIQELSWSSICSIPSSSNCEGDTLVGVVNHPNWLTFVRPNTTKSDYPRVVVYINIRLSFFQFSIHKDIINHRHILLASFFNNRKLFWLMNIYSDASHSTLKHLKDAKVNIRNLLIMMGNFNIRNSLWDPSFLHHLSISDDLIIITDSFNLSLSVPTNQIPTRYADNINDSNSTIDLVFLQCNSPALNNHSIHSEWCLSSNYAPLTVIIPISEEFINTHKNTTQKDSTEEAQFVKDTINTIKNLNILNFSDIHALENVVNDFAKNMDNVWNKNVKLTNIMRHSKSWWDDNCSSKLKKYRLSKSLEDWKFFCKTVKNTKKTFFDLKIMEIANKKQGPWELINWVNK